MDTTAAIWVVGLKIDALGYRALGVICFCWLYYMDPKPQVDFSLLAQKLVFFRMSPSMIDGPFKKCP